MYRGILVKTKRKLGQLNTVKFNCQIKVIRTLTEPTSQDRPKVPEAIVQGHGTLQSEVIPSVNPNVSLGVLRIRRVFHLLSVIGHMRDVSFVPSPCQILLINRGGEARRKSGKEGYGSDILPSQILNAN